MGSVTPAGGSGSTTKTRKPRSVLFVLGMHRSGTSALAGSLDHAGIDFGNVWRKPLPDNPHGHYENWQVANLNERIIGGWRHPEVTMTPEQTAPLIDGILRIHYNRDHLVGIKGPRFLFTLDHWLPHLDHAYLVGIFRHPLEVAASLDRRERDHGGSFPEDEAINLWVQYNERLLAYRKNWSFPILQFGRGIPGAGTVALSQQLARQVGGVVGRSAPHDGQDFFDPGAIHHAPTGGVPVAAVKVWDELCELAGLGVEPEDIRART